VEMLSNFKFSHHHNDVSITDYVAGFVSRGMTRNTKCKDCCVLFSEGEQPLEVEFADIDINPDDVAAGKSFLDVINRGGLFKSSDLMYVTCLHAAELYRFITEDEQLLKELVTSKNSMELFAEVFLSKLEELDNTNGILLIKCSSKHVFKHHARCIATVMFNLFAKNLVNECNNEIHKERKWEGTSEIKRDMTNMKTKKLKSS